MLQSVLILLWASTAATPTRPLRLMTKRKMSKYKEPQENCDSSSWDIIFDNFYAGSSSCENSAKVEKTTKYEYEMVLMQKKKWGGC